MTFHSPPWPLHQLAQGRIPVGVAQAEAFDTDHVKVYWVEVPLSEETVAVKGYLREPSIFCPDSGGLSLKLCVTHERYRSPMLTGACFTVMRDQV